MSKLGQVNTSFYYKFVALVFCFFMFSHINAQTPISTDSNGLQLIRIEHADSGISFKQNGLFYHRLLGNVSIEHNGYNLTCDSAHFYVESNLIEAFSQVQINNVDGMHAKADSIKYEGNKHTAFMVGNAQIRDGASSLFAEELEYNLKTKIGRYTKSGIIQNEGTVISSEIGNYNGFTQQTYFKNNVSVENPKYNIESQELKYNIRTKVVEFLSESIILTDNNTINTRSGTYNSKTGEANFTSRTSVENEDQFIEGNTLKYYESNGKAIAKGKVIVIDQKENTQLNADYVEYIKKSDLGKAIGHVVIVDAKNQTQIICDKLNFNNKTGYGKAIDHVEIYDFANNSRILSNVAEYNKISGYGKATGDVYIENEGGKTILTSKEFEYNKKTGYAKASSEVIIIDTTEHSKLLAGLVQYNEKTKFMIATDKPKLITKADNDSLFMRADTIFSVKLSELDKLNYTEDKSGKKLFGSGLLFVDSTYETNPDDSIKILVANHTVRLYSDSMQATCDSLSYSQHDSMFRLFRAPILWSKNQQSNADTIYIKTKNNELMELNLIVNSLLVSTTGYKGYYDQVSGAFINAYFNNNEIQKVFVNQNAESLYYAKDDDGNFLGANKAESSSLDAFFTNKELDKILMKDNSKGTFYPIDGMTEQQKYLSTFKLLESLKPKSKLEILNN
jgi:lipopolysaccharide export system protein LptA